MYYRSSVFLIDMNYICVQICVKTITRNFTLICTIVLPAEVIIMRKTKSIEFKAEVTHTFLKTVSAYSNYGTGIIYFGINDDGSIKEMIL